MNLNLLGHNPKTLDPKNIISALLKIRGVDPKEQHAFLERDLPSLDEITQELELNRKNIEKAKAQILKAIKEGHKICIFGDYDADGITATAILWLTLHQLGAQALPFIPSRSLHGYGLSVKAVSHILSGQGFKDSQYPDFIPDLIITVDNGIVANEAVSLLKEQGKAVIITDHHQPASKLPIADTIIHSEKTSGAGISWIFARHLSDDSQYAFDRLDLATIGIVADQMPVVGVNRPLIKAGLVKIDQTKLLGLKQIMKLAGLSEKPTTTYDIGFRLGPRINAVGRIDDATLALRLLCSSRGSQVVELSQKMEEINQNRQDLTEVAIAHAIKNVPTNHKITLAASNDYHHGIIGLVASKLVDAYAKPALAMSIENDHVKGSARSVVGFNITKFLRHFKSYLTSVGGHDQAAGFSLKLENLAEFTEKIATLADQEISSELIKPKVNADLLLPFSVLTTDLALALSELEPYGLGNAKPRFATHNLQVLDSLPLGQSGKHYKMLVTDGQDTRTVLWFGGQDYTGPLKTLVYTLDINTWQNRQQLQLIAAYVEI